MENTLVDVAESPVNVNNTGQIEVSSLRFSFYFLLQLFINIFLVWVPLFIVNFIIIGVLIGGNIPLDGSPDSQTSRQIISENIALVIGFVILPLFVLWRSIKKTKEKYTTAPQPTQKHLSLSFFFSALIIIPITYFSLNLIDTLDFDQKILLTLEITAALSGLGYIFMKSSK